ncbi:imelysin family protein [Stutzerimonas azotifigens]|uniref:imelysin family protein n=1 Tax=Stutzerimonas azotifigens TaxID=291995 RepID=UPI0006888617|nr:imelysin family protein [Stutzerimonas azotifigens]
MPRSRLAHTAWIPLLTALALAGCGDDSDPFQQASSALADHVLLPSYQSWAETDRRLADSARAYCAGEQNLEQAREVLLDAQTAWAALQPMLVGPMGEGNRAWQVQFWPDKKNLVGRQVTNLLKAHPQLTRADIENGSVVVQGLTAYEYVLYDEAVDLAAPQVKASYCPLLVAIGEHQQALAADIVAQWQAKDGMVAQLRDFPNDRYAEPSEAIADILRLQVTALDGLKKKLGTPLGRQSKGHPQPYQAEAWRSEASLAMLGAALEGAERLWNGGGQPGLRSLLGDDQQALAKRIDEAYARAREALVALDSPLGTLLADEAGRARVNEFYQRLDDVHRLHQGELAKTLGIQIGFNAHDGD